eukprot:COSAG02_NODE_50298_length_321_cov_0.923423_1_plen_21_part_10
MAPRHGATTVAALGSELLTEH